MGSLAFCGGVRDKGSGGTAHRAVPTKRKSKPAETLDNMVREKKKPSLRDLSLQALTVRLSPPSTV